MPSLLCSSWLPSRTITGRIDSQIGFFFCLLRAKYYKQVTSKAKDIMVDSLEKMM